MMKTYIGSLADQYRSLSRPQGWRIIHSWNSPELKGE